MQVTALVRYVLAGIVIVALLAAGTNAAPAENVLITIATAGKQGIYYPAGGAICSLLNANRFEHGIRCLTLSTEGSIVNLKGLRGGLYDLALVQSDWQYHDYYGTDVFKDSGRDLGLRSVFSLHSEAFTVVARSDANIHAFADLKGKRVNVGPLGSGNRATLDVVLKAMGMSEEDFALAAELTSSEQASALCAGTLDAVVFTVGHPNRSLEDIFHACDAVLVRVSGPVIDELVATYPYYWQTTIPGGTYAGNPDPVRTFGLGATLVASARTDNDVVFELVKAVFDNFEAFKKTHPALAGLEKERMVHDGLTAPLHDGVRRYLRMHPQL